MIEEMVDDTDFDIDRVVAIVGITSKIVGIIMIGVGSILVYKGLTGK